MQTNVAKVPVATLNARHSFAGGEPDCGFVSLKSLAALLDTTRSSARRWMKQAQIHPVAMGRGRNGAIRFRWSEVQTWLATRQQVE